MPIFKTLDPSKRKKLLQQRDDAALWHKCRGIVTRRKLGPRNLTGQKIGQLSVVCRSPTTRRQWKCRCDCGNVLWMDKAKLKHSLNPSCGCVEIPEKPALKWKSGKEGTLSTWQWMKYRCLGKYALDIGSILSSFRQAGRRFLAPSHYGEVRHG